MCYTRDTSTGLLEVVLSLRRQLLIIQLAYLDKAHSDSTHLSKLIDCLKSMVYRSGEQSCKFLIVEYFQTATYNSTSNLKLSWQWLDNSQFWHTNKLTNRATNIFADWSDRSLIKKNFHLVAGCLVSYFIKDYSLSFFTPWRIFQVTTKLFGRSRQFPVRMLSKLFNS